MQRTQIIVVFVVLFAALCSGTYGTYKNGQSCQPKLRKPCGSKYIAEPDQYYPCTSCSGPNVCKKVTVYKKHYYQYVYKKKCSYYWFRYYCKYYCTQTDSCTYVKKYTSSQYTCCPGHTTAASPTDYHHYLYGNSNYYLKKHGCPRTIKNTTLQCLEELRLTEFINLLSKLELKSKLNSTNGGNITVFAPNNDILAAANLSSTLSTSDIDTILSSHVVNKLVPAVSLYDGRKISTAATDRFIHVTEIELKNCKPFNCHYYERIFINGNELSIRDACIASNGIVQVIDGVIDSSSKTISQVVQTSTHLSNLTSLLTAGNLLGFLNQSLPLLTLFAPTDEAFSKASNNLGIDLVQCLLSANNKGALSKFLLYHVTCGAEYSSSLVLRKKLVTKSCIKKRYYYYRYGYYYHRNKYYTVCKKLSVDSPPNGIGVGGAGAILTHLDVPASNGVIQYISLPLINPCLNITQSCSGFIQKRGIVPPPPPLLPPPPVVY